MSRIGIDVDGVLRDFCGSLVNVIKEKYPHYLKDEFQPEVEPSLDGGMITEWYLANNFSSYGFTNQFLMITILFLDFPICFSTTSQ